MLLVKWISAGSNIYIHHKTRWKQKIEPQINVISPGQMIFNALMCTLIVTTFSKSNLFTNCSTSHKTVISLDFSFYKHCGNWRFWDCWPISHFLRMLTPCSSYQKLHLCGKKLAGACSLNIFKDLSNFQRRVELLYHLYQGDTYLYTT